MEAVITESGRRLIEKRRKVTEIADGVGGVAADNSCCDDRLGSFQNISRQVGKVFG